jgi:hypothetical protein
MVFHPNPNKRSKTKPGKNEEKDREERQSYLFRF